LARPESFAHEIDRYRDRLWLSATPGHVVVTAALTGALLDAFGQPKRLRSILELYDCCAAIVFPQRGPLTMPIYKAPVEDVSFLLNDVFQIDRYDNLPGFSDASADVREAILSEAAKLSEEVLQPLNRVGDLEGCTRHDDGRVTTPKGFKEAFKQVAEGGWLGLSVPAEFGGRDCRSR
jgi:hypothetical protein